jgi:hypothetical protein
MGLLNNDKALDIAILYLSFSKVVFLGCRKCHACGAYFLKIVMFRYLIHGIRYWILIIKNYCNFVCTAAEFLDTRRPQAFLISAWPPAQPTYLYSCLDTFPFCLTAPSPSLHLASATFPYKEIFYCYLPIPA